MYMYIVFYKMWPCLFSLISNARSVSTFSEMHNIKYKPLTESFVCADSCPYVDRLCKMYIAISKHALFFFFRCTQCEHINY